MRRAACVLALLALLALPARASELGDALGTGAVAEAAPPEALAVLNGQSPEDADLDAGLARLWGSLRSALPGAVRETLRPLAAMLAVTLLCAAAESFAAAGGRDAADCAAFAGALAVAVIGARDVHSVLSLGTETLGRLREFSAVLLPTLTAAASAAGAPGAAGAVWAASAMFSDVLLRAADGFLLPLIRGFTALACAAAVLGERRMDGAVQLLRWGAQTALKLLAAAFTAYLGLTRVLGAAGDAAAVKTAKAVLSASLPVVGRMLSDASDALVAGAALLRVSVGVYGLLAVLGALLLPVLRLALRVLAFRAAAAVCAGTASERIARLIERLGASYALLLGLVGTAAAIEFLAICSLIRTVAP